MRTNRGKDNVCKREKTGPFLEESEEILCLLQTIVKGVRATIAYKNLAPRRCGTREAESRKSFKAKILAKIVFDIVDC